MWECLLKFSGDFLLFTKVEMALFMRSFNSIYDEYFLKLYELEFGDDNTREYF